MISVCFSVIDPAVLGPGMDVPLFLEHRAQLIARLPIDMQDGIDRQVLHPFNGLRVDALARVVAAAL